MKSVDQFKVTKFNESHAWGSDQAVAHFAINRSKSACYFIYMARMTFNLHCKKVDWLIADLVQVRLLGVLAL